VEISSARGALQIASREAARAKERVILHAPPDAYPPLVPALRKAAGGGVSLSLSSTDTVELPFASVLVAPGGPGWPAQPFLMVVDDRSALLATRDHDRVTGHWGQAATLVAATTLSIQSLREGRGV
jgi:hypothetical protein